MADKSAPPNVLRPEKEKMVDKVSLASLTEYWGGILIFLTLNQSYPEKYSLRTVCFCLAVESGSGNGFLSSDLTCILQIGKYVAFDF
jgi:hypothetical protein